MNTVFIVLVGNTILFCNVQDCYSVDADALIAHEEQCRYEAIMTMNIVDWKQKNQFKQIERIGGEKVLHCLEKIPDKYRTHSATNEPLEFLQKMLCQVQNLRQNPIVAMNRHYNNCIKQFNPKDHNGTNTN